MITGLAFTAFLFVGLPISLVLMLSALVFIVSTGNHILLDSLLVQLFGGVDSYGLLALPLFMLLGELMNAGGITRRLLAMAMAVIGGMRGSLAYVNVVANALMAAILGSATAQIAIMSQVLAPEMARKGYDRAFAVSTTVAAGLLSPIIPPSMMFVIYGVMVQVPIGDMFIAGIIPGLLLTFAFCLVIAIMGLWITYPEGDKVAAMQRIRSVLYGLPTLAIPAVMLGSILGGLATPTESAAIASLAALALGVLYREIDLRALPSMCLRTALNSAIVLYLVATANVFGWVLIYGEVPQAIGEWIKFVAHDPITFMLMLNVLLLFIGTVIDGAPGLILTVPIFFPIATEVYGIDPIQFGIVVSINLVLGLVSPPVGAALFIGAAVSGVPANSLFLKVLPFCLAVALILVALSIWPVLTLGLVR